MLAYAENVRQAAGSIDRVLLTTFRSIGCLASAGTDGECVAINSAIDELIPAPLRDREDPAVNGTNWLGAMIGAGAG